MSERCELVEGEEGVMVENYGRDKSERRLMEKN